MDSLRTIAEIAFGALFAIGAIFNTAYTLRNGPEFYRGWADGAWLPPARTVIERVVIPNATAVTVLVILVQGAIAALILTRGDLVQAALAAGAGFAVVAAAASSPGGTVGNLVLALLLATLSMTH